jgi:hypothetical protein
MWSWDLLSFWKFIFSVTLSLRICAVSDDACYHAMTCLYPGSSINRIANFLGCSMMLAVFSFTALWMYNGFESVHNAAHGGLVCMISTPSAR